MFRSKWSPLSKMRRLPPLAAFIATYLCCQIVVPTVANASTIVSKSVLDQLKASPTTPVWVYLTSTADLSGVDVLKTRQDRGRYVYTTLSEHARTTQAPLTAFLAARGVRFKSHFLVNAVLVYADKSTVQELAARKDVKRISTNPTIPMLRSPDSVESPPMSEAASSVEWNVQAIKAPDVWNAGFYGQGVVVAGADTGVDWDHPAIKRQYRGNSGSSVNHNYNWFDGIGNGAEPYDDHSHGTFTVGEIVGDDGAGNQIGVAPKATWIACKNMDAGGNGTPDSYITCFEWFLAPTDANGQNPNADKAPHIVNNSWSCPSTEGCERETLHEIVDRLSQAGIILIFSAGNSGSACRTVNEPPAYYPGVFSVGASDSSNVIASFSSRGPSSYDGSLKPNVTAPGVNVRSSMPGGAYGYMSGTSMAAPEVVGAMALLGSATPTILDDEAALASLLEQSATFKNAAKCGGNRTEGYNNIYGYGLLNVKAAYDALRLSAPTP